MRLFHPFQTDSAPRWLLELEPLSGHGKQTRLLWYLLQNSELRRGSVTRCSQKAPRLLWVAVMLLSGLPDRKRPKRAVHVVRGSSGSWTGGSAKARSHAAGPALFRARYQGGKTTATVFRSRLHDLFGFRPHWLSQSRAGVRAGECEYVP